MTRSEQSHDPSQGQPPGPLTKQTLLDKIWTAHAVTPETTEAPALLYVDLHLIHEVTSPQAFTVLGTQGLSVRRPDRTVATADHAIATAPEASINPPSSGPAAAAQVARLADNCRAAGIPYYPPGDARHGIVHVTIPEQGRTRPGMTIVCGDSHTSTHGAFGALAFGIGTSEVAHVLASQTLLQRKPRNLRVTILGQRPAGVTAKDLALAAVQTLGAGGGQGYVLEFAGPVVRAMTMDERMTLCNMAIEAGARAGMVGPDEVTFAYLAKTPAGAEPYWDQNVARWRALATDPDAVFDREVSFDASALTPMITWGTAPDMVMAIDGTVPESAGDPARVEALTYMGLKPGQALLGHPVNVVFIGSCTNGRLSDLRAAATIFAGRSVAPGVRALVVPGSQAVRVAAEQEGLADIFRAAGAEWHAPGCSLCIAMNGDRLAPGQVAVSTSNRNFPGRQGPGGRTLLASPVTAAAAAVSGHVADPRPLMEYPQ